MFLMALTLSAVPLPPRPMEVEVVRDPITDAVRAFATVREGGHRLVVSCEPEEYEGVRVAFHSRRWLARGNVFTGGRAATFRFDRQPPIRTMWDVDDRRGRLGGKRAALFVRYLVAAQRLVIRARDIEGREFDMLFRLEGVRAAVDHALTACAAAPAKIIQNIDEPPLDPRRPGR